MPDARASSRTQIGAVITREIAVGGVLPARAAVPRRRPSRTRGRRRSRSRARSVRPSNAALYSAEVVVVFAIDRDPPSHDRALQCGDAAPAQRDAEVVGIPRHAPSAAYFESPRHDPNALAVRGCQQDRRTFQLFTRHYTSVTAWGRQLRMGRAPQPPGLLTPRTISTSATVMSIQPG